MPPDVRQTEPGPIDMHVHIVGNGAGGTGCWMRVRGLHRLGAYYMLRHAGLPLRALHGDLDGLYVERLLELVRESSLQAIVILAHEQVYDESGRLRKEEGAFHVPNSYVLKLAATYREFLPAVSIHPARPDALEELDRCVAAGAVMMKCLPNCQNIDCSSRRYQKFWERMAELRLPLLAHTGGEMSLPVVRPDLADPRILELPLQCGVTVIAAHCGTPSGPFDRDYFPSFLEMTRRYPRLFGDISALNQIQRCGHLRDCRHERIYDRIVHGSDFPIPVFGHGAFARGWVAWKPFRRWQRNKNVLERDYQLKRAIGFGDSTFNRIHQLLRVVTPS